MVQYVLHTVETAKQVSNVKGLIYGRVEGLLLTLDLYIHNPYWPM